MCDPPIKSLESKKRSEYSKQLKVLDECGKEVDRSKDNWVRQFKNSEKAKLQYEKVWSKCVGGLSVGGPLHLGNRIINPSLNPRFFERFLVKQYFKSQVKEVIIIYRVDSVR